MLITLTTDFGYRDPFVGIMKGVIAGIHPEARVIDLSHGVPPQDLMAAALLLRHSTPYFPRRTVHVAVVDPGVGSERRPLLIESDGHYFVGPDNGVLSLALEEKNIARIVHLSNADYYLRPTSATFHGRDIFAPIAAYLSLGLPARDFGEEVEDFVRLPWPTLRRSEQSIEGEIVYIDGFGNLVTNISERELASASKENIALSLGDVTVRGLVNNYTAGQNGGFIALVNSWGLVEVSRYRDSAKARSQAEIGDRVQLRLK